MAEDLTQITRGSGEARDALRRLQQRCDMIVGRGACHHPDGVVRLVRSALVVFAADIDDHVNGGPCLGALSARRYVPVPSLEHEDELIWQ
jgi:NADH:ubiquinone oxidoreductase subunit F (NADH-binding)